jgi:ketosteroid isomerase-like protein
MSQENVEFVEGIFAGTESLGKEELLAALPEIIRQTCHPDIEWVEHPDLLDRRIHRGHDGVRQSWERWFEQWDEYGFEVERVIDYGEDVLAIARENARGKTSGARVSSRIYVIFTLREGKIARYQEFHDEGAALEALDATE